MAASGFVDRLESELDPSSNQVLGRVGGTLFLMGGIIIAATIPLGTAADHGALLVVAGACVGAGLVALALPWERWTRRALLGQTAVALLLVALTGQLAPASISGYLPMLVPIFMFVGLTQEAGYVLWTVPVAAVAYLSGTEGTVTHSAVAFVVTLAVSVIAGLTLAAMLEQHRQTRTRMVRLLGMTRALGHVGDVRETIELVEANVSELAGADAILTFVADAPGSTCYRSLSAPPEGVDGPLTIDIAVEPSALGRAIEREEICFIADTATEHQISPRLRRLVPFESMLVVPFGGNDGPIGGLVAGWWQPAKPLDELALAELEMLAGETGSVLERLLEVERIAEEAMTDGLTGLLNRRAIERRLQNLETGDAVLVFDLDRFKDVNDCNGHAAGDVLLRSFADCLRECCRTTDWCARFGGDEFMIVVRGGGVTGADTVSRKVQQAWHDRSPMTTASAGAAVHLPGRTPTETVADADAALYSAKAKGRDRAEVFAGHLLAEGSQLVVPRPHVRWSD
jgi:diguanylate cyclase (GGDEF)-like protein